MQDVSSSAQQVVTQLLLKMDDVRRRNQSNGNKLVFIIGATNLPEVFFAEGASRVAVGSRVAAAGTVGFAAVCAASHEAGARRNHWNLWEEGVGVRGSVDLRVGGLWRRWNELIV